MAWTETCKIDAVAQINKRKEICGTLRKALRELSKESGISYGTLKRWYYPEGVPNNGNTLPKLSVEKETFATSDLYALPFDKGRKKIVFGLRETYGNRSIVTQEFKVSKNGKETPTKNCFTMSVDLISHFRSALDQVEMMIQERCSGEPDVDVPDPQEDDKVEPPVGDDGGLSQNNEVDGTEV